MVLFLQIQRLEKVHRFGRLSTQLTTRGYLLQIELFFLNCCSVQVPFHVSFQSLFNEIDVGIDDFRLHFLLLLCLLSCLLFDCKWLCITLVNLLKHIVGVLQTSNEAFIHGLDSHG